MRRSLAILLAMLFSWLLILPVFASASQSNLPACCRKNGKHHCALQQAQSAPSSPAFSTLNVKCPCCPQSTSAVSSLQFYSPATSQAVFAGLIQHPALSPQTEAVLRISRLRSHQKRGPPSSLFFILTIRNF